MDFPGARMLLLVRQQRWEDDGSVEEEYRDFVTSLDTTVAYLANAAAHEILSKAQRGEMIAILCRRFIDIPHQGVVND